MDTKHAKALTHLWSTKSGHSCCIDQKVWYFAGDPKPRQAKYSFTYFTSHADCQNVAFESFKAVEKFIHDYVKGA